MVRREHDWNLPCQYHDIGQELGPALQEQVIQGQFPLTHSWTSQSDASTYVL